MCCSTLVGQKNQKRGASKLIKITTLKDISKIENGYVRQYIEKLIKHLLNEYKEYCTDGSITSIGAIYFAETDLDLKDYKTFGLVNPMKESRFESVEEIGKGFSHGIIVVSNDYAISIFSPNEVFNKHFERMEHNEHD